MAFTETIWLGTATGQLTINELVPESYGLISILRKSGRRLGGISIYYK